MADNTQGKDDQQRLEGKVLTSPISLDTLPLDYAPFGLPTYPVPCKDGYTIYAVDVGGYILFV